MTLGLPHGMHAGAPRTAPVPPPARIPDDTPVFPGHDAPTFGQDEWDLSNAVSTPNFRVQRVCWTWIESAEFRYAWKAVAFRRLRQPVADWRKIKPETLAGFVEHAKQAAKMLNAMGVQRPSEITPALGAELLRRAEDLQRCPTYTASILNAAVQLYAFRDHLPDAPTQHPFKGKAPGRLLGTARNDNEENTTPRIPERVMGPLLQWALRYIDDFADEILTQPPPPRQPHHSDWPRKQSVLLTRYLDELRSAGHGLPTKAPGRTSPWPGRTPPDLIQRVNWSAVSAAADTKIDLTKLAPETVALIDTFLEEVGFEADRVLRADERETVLLLRGTAGTPYVVRLERSHLAVACYIVIAYLTGMRDSEVHGLRRGCLRQEKSADGLQTRWFIRGRVYKRRPTPEQADWVAIEPVVRAVRVLERLNDARGTAATARLTGAFRLGPLKLNEWCRHVNKLAARSLSTPAIPEWSLTTRQFRRTFAWYLANRPGGVIAGMIQYQQASVEIFEGYHGKSKSGFQSEVEMERALASEVALQDVYEQWLRGVHLTGSGATALVTSFQEVHAILQAEVNPTDRRVRDLLKSKSVHLHVGLLTDCRFEEATARCLQTASKPRPGSKGPIINVCNKRDCRHAVVTERHRPLWESCVADTTKLLQDPALSVPQRAALEAELKRQLTVIGKVDPNVETTA